MTEYSVSYIDPDDDTYHERTALSEGDESEVKLFYKRYGYKNIKVKKLKSKKAKFGGVFG